MPVRRARRAGFSRSRWAGGRGRGLALEVLEGRTLLSGMALAEDVDGDEVVIKVTGPGNIVSSDPTGVQISETTEQSKITITVRGRSGDGEADIDDLQITGVGAKQIRIDGNLGGLSTAYLEELVVGRISDDNAAADGVVDIGTGVRKFIVKGGVRDADVNILGEVEQMVLGVRNTPSGDVENSTIDIGNDAGRVRIVQTLGNGSALTVLGNLDRLDVLDSLSASTVTVQGNADRVEVKGAVSGGATLTINGEASTIRIRGNLTGSSVIDVAGAVERVDVGKSIDAAQLFVGSLGGLRVKDDVRLFDLASGGDVESMRMRNVDVVRFQVSGYLHEVQVREDLDDALVSVLRGIDVMDIKGDLGRSNIWLGTDIGRDLALGTGDDGENGEIPAGQFKVGRSIIDTNISAGINPVDGVFGNGDDAASNGGLGTAVLGMLKVKDEITTSGVPGEMYYILSDDIIDQIVVGGRPFNGSDDVVVAVY